MKFFFQSSYVLYARFALLVLIRCDLIAPGSSTVRLQTNPMRIHRAGKLVRAYRLRVRKIANCLDKAFISYFRLSSLLVIPKTFSWRNSADVF
jgi:hypothetical protein